MPKNHTRASLHLERQHRAKLRPGELTHVSLAEVGIDDRLRRNLGRLHAA